MKNYLPYALVLNDRDLDNRVAKFSADALPFAKQCARMAVEKNGCSIAIIINRHTGQVMYECHIETRVVVEVDDDE